MVDLYLGDYSKSIEDIGQLIMDYGESGRAYMVNFFIADSVYIIISVLLFSLLIKGVTLFSSIMIILIGGIRLILSYVKDRKKI